MLMTRRDYWEREIGPGRSFTTSDAARICEVTPRQVRRWISQGKLMALGSSEDSTYDARIPRESLITFLVKRTPPSQYPFLQGSLF